MKVVQSFTFPTQWVKQDDLRLPQARVLRALLPATSGAGLPVYTRVQLSDKAGFSRTKGRTSGTINRALGGIREGSSSGGAQKGLLELGFVVPVDLNGAKGYQITPEGLKAIERHLELPDLKDKASCTNDRYLQDIAEIEEQPGLDSTSKAALIDARRGQGKFRLQVLESWGDCCSVTGSRIQAAIRASHIKPWRESSNAERLDPNNGLPLIASLDALFDAGLISFDASGNLLVSATLAKAEREIFGIIDKSLRKKPTAKSAKYLAYHREKHCFAP